MSDDIYDEHLDVVQDNEIGPSGRSLMAPDAVALGGPAWHQGADYGLPDTTVTVVDGTQCVHDGVAYHGGETADVPAAVAQHWVRSGWATTDFDGEDPPEPSADSKAAPGRAAPAKAMMTRRPSP